MNSASRNELSELRKSINNELMLFCQGETKYLREIGSELEPVAVAMERFALDSGKRLRPLFSYVGFLGTGAKSAPEIIQACAALELVHVCALMHDDVMDGSDTRRGAPSIHKSFEAMHADKKLVGSAENFGTATAILLGDLALVWSAKMLHQSGLESATLIRALPMYDEMRIELMAGQYLDVYEQALGSSSVDRSLKVARYKSGKYTIERPLHFGAALGSKDPEQLMNSYSSYGLPLGEAFQLRDDVLGIFGNPAETGKPAGDDLRESKRTVLLAKTMEFATPAGQSIIKSALGNPNLSASEIEAAREIMKDSGALKWVEDLIESLTSSAREAIEHGEIEPLAKQYLGDLADIVTRRSL